MIFDTSPFVTYDEEGNTDHVDVATFALARKYSRTSFTR